MKKILFVDHDFHKKTRSSDFFMDILKKRFEVELFYLVADGHLDLGLLRAAENADAVVLWQMDFLAPVFLAQGKPTFVIPMYDGSNGMPELHWLAARGARFFNFSLALHERTRMLGAESLLLRYFPEPVDESDLPRFDDLKGFFWQRRPDHGIDYAYVDKLVGTELDALHVHKVADIAGDFTPQVRDDVPYHYTSSDWFASKADYRKQLHKANVFVAPRCAEGIGMALLEAMARGMLVMAHDEPTNNEYVCSWVNGILFNKYLPASPVHIRSDAARLGRMAWQTVVDGRRQWLSSYDKILDWIETAPHPKSVDIDIRSMLIDVWYSYYASLASYTAFLHRNIALIAKMSDMPLSKVIEALRLTDNSGFQERGLHERLLDDDGSLDVLRKNDKFIGGGWSGAEEEWRWVEGIAADLHFAVPVPFRGQVNCRFFAASLPQLGASLHCAIVINDVRVFDGHLTPEWAWRDFTFNSNILRIDNDLHLILENAAAPPGDKRILSAAFHSFTFSQAE
jgi:hypothetical protein